MTYDQQATDRKRKLDEEAASTASAGDVGATSERLISVGIIRNGVTYGAGFDSHAALRASLGDALPSTSQLNDEEGFITSTGRFVSRWCAVPIAVDAGQISDMWNNAGRRLLSSDINWKATK